MSEGAVGSGAGRQALNASQASICAARDAGLSPAAPAKWLPAASSSLHSRHQLLAPAALTDQQRLQTARPPAGRQHMLAAPPAPICSQAAGAGPLATTASVAAEEHGTTLLTLPEHQQATADPPRTASTSMPHLLHLLAVDLHVVAHIVILRLKKGTHSGRAVRQLHSRREGWGGDTPRLAAQPSPAGSIGSRARQAVAAADTPSACFTTVQGHPTFPAGSMPPIPKHPNKSQTCHAFHPSPWSG